MNKLAPVLMSWCLLSASPQAQWADRPTESAPEDKPHHTAHGFRNVHPDYREKNFGDFLKWRWQQRGNKPLRSASAPVESVQPDIAFLKSNRSDTTLTWIGHATVLLQLDGRNILTDPHFSKRASPVQWVGPKRLVPPLPALEDLPEIDLVVISHDHYDSLDLGTVKALRNRSGGDRTLFLVPLGLKRWFLKQGVTRVRELDWWEEYRSGDLAVTAVPVQHWSKRSLLGRNRTLWAGWVLRTPTFRFLFAGDTGYTAHFKEIGDRLGPFDAAALPIGAYEPRWFMKDHHMNPDEAVQAHLDLRSRLSVAIHWGTFSLTDEPADEPPRRLREALRNRLVPAAEFRLLKIGETLRP